MKIDQVWRSSLAGGVIYVAMAACASSTDHGAASSDSDGGNGGALADVLQGVGNPVPTASAASPTATLDVASEPCNKTFPYTASGITNQIPYAEHPYPGATMEELASSVVVLVPVPASASPPPVVPPGYDHQPGIPYPRAGAVATLCATGSSVTFIRR